MADATRPASFLPSIKCSSCSAEIEISKMADHVCAVSRPPATSILDPHSAAPTRSQASSAELLRKRISQTRDAGATGGEEERPKPSGLLRPGKMVQLPRIDPSAANKPFLLSRDQLTPLSNASGARTPPIPHSARKASNPKLLRSTTAPAMRPFSPPSPDLPLSQDCAFPAFPTTRSRSNTPTEGLLGKTPPNHNYAEANPMYGPVSPRVSGGANVLRRMNTISPGPFDGRRERNRSISRPATPGHKRSGTASSGISGHSRKSSNSSRDSSARVSSSGSEKLRASGQSVEKPTVPTAAVEGASSPPRSRTEPPPRPVRPDEKIDEFLEKLQQESKGTPPEPLNPENRSRTFPLRKESQDDVTVATSGPLRGSPEPTFQQRRQRQASFSRPLPETIPALKPDEDETRGRQIHTSALRLNSRSSSRTGHRKVRPPPDAPPVPPIQRLQTQIDSNPLHTPTDSASSDGSSLDLGSRVGSAISSPPSSVASGELRRPSNPEIQNLPSQSTPAQVRKPQPATGLPDPALRSLAFHGSKPEKDAETNMSRPTAPEPLLPPRRPSITEGPESPMDPAIQRGLFSRRWPPTSDANPPSPKTTSPPRHPSIPTLTSHEAPSATSLTHPETPLERRPTTPRSKGTCRGCTQPIIGKSVKAADGRLTGRYHRQCFVCKTCRAPFATADFYVINNEPYCERHYHTLNKSLCQCCDRGIEGQYLETEQRQKFHPACFKCQQCRVLLREEYFEVAGQVYCERHAWEAGRQNTGAFLGPGGRKNPARRTTRLMMM